MVYVSCKTIIMVACHFIWIVTLTRRGWYKPVWRTRKLMKTKTAPRLFQVFFILIMSWGCVVSRIILNSSLSLIQINIFSLFPLRFLWNISIHCYGNFFFTEYQTHPTFIIQFKCEFTVILNFICSKI